MKTTDILSGSNATRDSVALRTTLESRTLVVGNKEGLVTSFPALADEFLNCKNVEICGDLNNAPADDLWKRHSNPLLLSVYGS